MFYLCWREAEINVTGKQEVELTNALKEKCMLELGKVQ